MATHQFDFFVRIDGSSLASGCPLRQSVTEFDDYSNTRIYFHITLESGGVRVLAGSADVRLVLDKPMTICVEGCLMKVWIERRV